MFIYQYIQVYKYNGYTNIPVSFHAKGVLSYITMILYTFELALQLFINYKFAGANN